MEFLDRNEVVDGERIYELQPLWWHDDLRKDLLWNRALLGAEMCLLWRVF